VLRRVLPHAQTSFHRAQPMRRFIRREAGGVQVVDGGARRERRHAPEGAVRRRIELVAVGARVDNRGSEPHAGDARQGRDDPG